MRLLDLDAKFVGEVSPDGKGFRTLEAVDGAQGVMFLCPKCFAANGGRVGTHSVICWFRSPRGAPPVPAGMRPAPGRWDASGDTIDTLSLSPSVQLLSSGGCLWHGWVKDGGAE